MATFERGALPAVDLPAEEVTVPSLPGPVLVRGLDMPQMLQFSAARTRLETPQDGEDEAAARERASAHLVPLLLSLSVVLDDGLPVFSAGQWAAFGARHADDVITLFNVAVRLGGQDAGGEKKA